MVIEQIMVRVDTGKVLERATVSQCADVTLNRAASYPQSRITDEGVWYPANNPKYAFCVRVIKE